MGADNQAEKVIDRIERMEQMQVEIESLKEQLATCRELREYDRGTIKEQLAKIIELFKQLGVR